MSTEAVIMMLVAMLVIWGGLAASIVSLVRHGAVDDRPDAPRRRPRG